MYWHAAQPVSQPDYVLRLPPTSVGVLPLKYYTHFLWKTAGYPLSNSSRCSKQPLSDTKTFLMYAHRTVIAYILTAPSHYSNLTSRTPSSCYAIRDFVLNLLIPTGVRRALMSWSVWIRLARVILVALGDSTLAKIVKGIWENNIRLLYSLASWPMSNLLYHVCKFDCTIKFPASVRPVKRIMMMHE